MKAIVIPKHGGPEVLQGTEIGDPKPGPGEVVVRVRACALNHLDLWVRRCLNGVTFPLPLVPGSDISGEVAVVGAAVQRVRAGDKVILAPGVSCGQCAACAAGRDNECRKYTLFGYGRNGGCAEYVLAPEENVLSMPAGLSFEEAAAVPLVFLTAWHMLVARARLQPGEEVLILGAGSGVGSAAIQIAKLMGARVIATAGSRTKRLAAPSVSARAQIQSSACADVDAEHLSTGVR